MNNDKTELLNTLRIDRKQPAPSAAPETRPSRLPLYVGGLLVAGALAGGAWWMTKASAQPVHIAQAHVLATGASASGTLLDATGYAVAQRAATVGPKIAGKLRDVLVEEGMHVQAGQVLAHLDDSNAMAALNQAKASFEQAQTAAADARPVYDRSQAQLAKGLISREAFDQAKATYDQAQTTLVVSKAALAVAEQNEADTVIVAPFTGVVTVKAAQAGEIISPLSAGAGFTRTGIATIVDMDSIEVEVDVSENYINRIRPDQPSSITLNAYPDWKIPGHVVAVVPTADRSKATVKVRVGFDVKDPRILPEMGARVGFLSDAKPGAVSAAPSGVVVPAEAVVASGGQNALFVVRDDNHVERRAVKLGAKTAAGQIVLSGLSSGETVAVSDTDKLADGAKVKIEQ